MIDYAILTTALKMVEVTLPSWSGSEKLPDLSYLYLFPIDGYDVGVFYKERDDLVTERSPFYLAIVIVPRYSLLDFFRCIKGIIKRVLRLKTKDAAIAADINLLSAAMLKNFSAAECWVVGYSSAGSVAELLRDRLATKGGEWKSFSIGGFPVFRGKEDEDRRCRFLITRKLDFVSAFPWDVVRRDAAQGVRVVTMWDEDPVFTEGGMRMIFPFSFLNPLFLIESIKAHYSYRRIQ